VFISSVASLTSVGSGTIYAASKGNSMYIIMPSFAQTRWTQTILKGIY
jgi:hypothetical protein